MPNYLITDNETGRKFKVTGDSPPTEAEAAQIFADMGAGGSAFPSKEENERQRQKFLKEEAAPLTYVKEKAKEAGRGVAPYVRPLLEAGGAVAGGLTGTAAGGGVASAPAALLGAGLGYATGAKAADVFENLVDAAPARQQPQTIPGQLLQTGTDVLLGATMEAGGQLAGRGVGWAWDKGKQAVNAVRRVSPALSEKAVKAKAGQLLQENMGTAPQYEANALEAQALERDIPGYKMSLAEQRNDPGLIKLQRGLERAGSSETPAANLMAEQKAANVDALKMHLADQFPGSADIAEVSTKAGANRSALETATADARQAADAMKTELPAKHPQQIGADILSEWELQAAPVKATMQEMGEAIPNYPIATNNLNKEAGQFATSRLVTIQEKKALRPILEDIAARTEKGRKMGLKELQTVQRNINDTISRELEGKASGDLMKLKQAIQRDLDEFSDVIGSGKQAVYKGRLVDLDKLAAEYETNAATLANMKQGTIPDIDAMVAKLKEIDTPSQVYRQADANDKGVNDRIVEAYQKKFGEPLVKVDAQDARVIDELRGRQQIIRDTLAGVDPAIDAAAMYRAYNRYAQKEYFDKFERGAMGRIIRRGNEASGTQTQLANIPQQFTRADGADDLIHAYGQERAGELMDQYFAHDLLQKVNPATGELPASVAQNWLKQHAAVLEKYGLSAKYGSLADAQAAVEMAKDAEKQFAKSAAGKILNADLDKAIESAFQTYPKNTARAAAELRDAMQGDSQALEGLQNAFKDFLVKRAEATVKTIGGDAVIGAASLQKEMQHFEPALQVLYANEPAKIKALKDVQQAVEISARSSRSPLGGGSDTAENLNAAKSIIGKLVEHIPGTRGVLQLGKLGLEKLGELNQKEVNRLLARALYDPDLAQTLIAAARGTMKPEIVRTKINHQLITAGIVAATSPMTHSREDIEAELKRRGY